MPISPTTVSRKGGSSGSTRGTKASRATGVPVGVGEHARDDVGQVDQREDDEDALDDLVGQAQHEQEDDDHRDRNRQQARDAKDLRGRGDAGELGRGDRGVDHEEAGHRQERDAQAEVLADQSGTGPGR